MQRFGATPEAWDHFADTLKLSDDLLPVVSNPHALISDKSKMRALGKTPSIYNREGKVVGLPKWSQLIATEHLIQRWKAEPDYGICLQTRKVRAFDIDVDTPFAAAIAEAIMGITGPLPARTRDDSNKLLLGFTYNRPLTKHVVPVDGGMVEILADGQQFIAAGTHPGGATYEWLEGLPPAFPVLTGEQFDKVWTLLTTLYAVGEPRIARERRAGAATGLEGDDHVAQWLLENWECYDAGREGQVYIDCPFSGDHTTDSGPSSTAYFPAGTGGYAQGHFVCLHAHCSGRDDRDFLDATGYNLAQFADLTALDPLPLELAAPAGVEPSPAIETPSEPRAWPAMVRDKKGKIEPTAENIFTAVQDGGMIYKQVAYDSFTDNLVWAPLDQPRATAQWRNFSDADMVDIRIELERRGFKPMGKELLRECVHAAGSRNAIDTATEWLSRLRWDGVERIARFAVDCWGWEDTPYSWAVGEYVWTALAGRVMQPGVRADMAPILVGAQGIRKTTLIQAMAPSEEFYAEIKLNDRDDDLSRKLRGKLIGELEELRGLNSRALEEIKAFVSRRRESWVPKYKEFENFYWRRCLLVGTTNETELLADPTGERRWLPGKCRFIDVDRIEATRDQLWAEGAFRFSMNGVMWQGAETLAKQEHGQFKVSDSWERAIQMWLTTPNISDTRPLDKGYVTAGEVMSAIGITPSQQNRTHELRIQRALKHLGYVERIVEENGVKLKGFGIEL
jgi:predicted P-loop ATPase